MKAIAVRPGKAGSIHLAELPRPSLREIADGRGVLVQVVRVGVDGTDKEINDALYGKAPPGANFLVIGHEGFGRVVETGKNVPDSIQPGDYVVASVRRPGTSLYDDIGFQDLTTDEVYYERGINLLHGYLTEFYVEDYQYLVTLPPSLREVGVLLEPLSISQKAVRHAYEIQRRLKIWRPERAAVLGSGTIGLLAALTLRLKGLDLTVYSKRKGKHLNSELVEALGGRYVSTQVMSVAEAGRKHGPFDIILDATGYSPLPFEASEALAKNGVLIMTSVTGGDRHAELPTDKINQRFVLGNQVMFGSVNAARVDFLSGVDDLIKAETIHPGWLKRLLTTPIDGLENYEQMIDHLTNDKDAIKVYVDVVRP
ncbi:MAG TPA: glucose 1-dehydrogenase [Dehalococcoidia bacterium]|nr:glucose 1-dehydrogenase [Dehalococcoidia bacterium]